MAFASGLGPSSGVEAARGGPRRSRGFPGVPKGGVSASPASPPTLWKPGNQGLILLFIPSPSGDIDNACSLSGSQSPI